MTLVDPSASGAQREVGCELTFDITEESLLALQVAPATTAGTLLEERIELACNGNPSAAPRELAADHGGRIHLLPAPVGALTVRYSAVLRASDPSPPAPSTAAPSTAAREVTEFDAVVGLRQSRYCPSDALAGFAAAQFVDDRDGERADIAQAVASWVFERLAYTGGASGPLDTAVDTLLSGAGVCRDFAHLAIALCRALGVPARLVSVYAPGLFPMDFHAVVEVCTADGWQVLDPTRLAPRRALVRIATGRDAADTAFATTLRGSAELVASFVFASSDGWLPADDHERPVPIA